MYGNESNSGRVGQSTYWMFFLAYFLSTLACVGFGIYELFTLNFAFGLLSIGLVFPVYLYFRVIMMRRCRDINWPSFLPWLSMGCVMLAGMASMSSLSQIALNPRAVPSGMIFQMLFSTLDFVFMIVIGCLPSKTSYFDPDREYKRYAQEYGVNPRANQNSNGYNTQRDVHGDTSEGGQAHWDSVIANRLAALEGSSESSAPVQMDRDPFTAPQRPATGFGRKIV